MKKLLKVKSFICGMVIFFGVVSVPILASACSNLGSGKHMGVVRMIDPIKGVISIIDAETRRPIQLVTREDLLKVVHVNDTVVVTFEKENDQLIAKKIVVHASALGLL